MNNVITILNKKPEMYFDQLNCIIETVVSYNQLLVSISVPFKQYRLLLASLCNFSESQAHMFEIERNYLFHLPKLSKRALLVPDNCYELRH